MREFHKDQLLAAVFYTMTPEQRRRLMLSVPEAYNAYSGRRVAVVTDEAGNEVVA